MSDQTKLARALLFATEKHKGQMRKGGGEYITHPIAVSEIVKEEGYGEDYQITGLFHDLLEDTDAKEDEIAEIGGEKVLEAVRLLTKHKGYVMEEYIAGIKANPMAKVVKAADRLHNLRCAVCCSEEFKRKYILESIDYYLDFSPEIGKAVKNLALTMEKPMTELSFLYDFVETWKITEEDKGES